MGRPSARFGRGGPRPRGPSRRWGGPRTTELFEANTPSIFSQHQRHGSFGGSSNCPVFSQKTSSIASICIIMFCKEKLEAKQCPVLRSLKNQNHLQNQIS